jgi:site-specific recombinase XerC
MNVTYITTIFVLQDVGAYRDGLVGRFTPASVKLHFAALRHFFDVLTTRHVVVVIPASAVRGPRHEAVAGKTLQTSVEQAPTKAAIP